MEKTLTYFLSDFHLGARYIDNPAAHERRIVDFLESVKNTAKEIYLLGDILDYWYEYRYVVPRGFVRFFGKLAELSDNGTDIYWFIGNHDIWIFDYLPNELGVKIIDAPIVKTIGGKRFFLDHGDGVGQRKRSFRILRSVFRNKTCQKALCSNPSALDCAIRAPMVKRQPQRRLLPAVLGRKQRISRTICKNIHRRNCRLFRFRSPTHHARQAHWRKKAA